MLTLGEKLRKARESANFSQLQAAEISGIGYKTINNYEKNVSRPDVEKLALLCVSYKVSADSIIELDTKKATAAEDSDSIAAESQEVAIAYAKAELRERQIVRFTLKLPPKDGNV